MKARFIASFIIAVAVLAALVLVSTPAAAQVKVPGYEGINPIGPNGQVVNRKAIPRTADGHPDFTGVWAGPGFSHKVGRNDTDVPGVGRFEEKLFPPYAPGGETRFLEKNTGDNLHDDPTALCLPDGYPREALTGYATEINQFPGLMYWRYEYMHFDKVVPTDGRPHPKDVELTFMGDSVARWEGDTLVMDTIGLRKWTLDATSEPATRYHSDKLHVIDRIRYIDPMTAEWQMTLDDPLIWTKPWTSTYQMKLHPTWRLYEQVCEENNRCNSGKCTQADVQKK